MNTALIKRVEFCIDFLRQLGTIAQLILTGVSLFKKLLEWLTKITPWKRRRIAKFFISYVEQDLDRVVAYTFQEGLVRAGHHVFMSRENSGFGKAHSRRIDDEMPECDYFIVLLSPLSIEDPNVTQEVFNARILHRKNVDGYPHILPIYLNLQTTVPLSYDLRVSLWGIGQRVWQNPTDTPNIIQEILSFVALPKAARPNTSAIAQRSFY